MQTHPSTVPLTSLSPDDAVNARKTNIGPDAALIASIRIKGLTTPLTVRPNGKGYAITDGRRRYLAMKQLVDGGFMPADVKVPVFVRAESDAEARDTSLTTLIVRAPPHPVDRFEAFSSLLAGGMGEADIAARYAMTGNEVRQALALGTLSAKVRDAWRSGDIDADAAMAFTLAPSIKDQERVLAKHSGHPSAWDVKHAFVGRQEDIGKMIAFVGLAELRKAGARINEDLFGISHTATDPKVVKKMVDEKIDAECARLIADGWSWATSKDDHSGQYWHQIGYGSRRGKPTPAESARLKELEATINSNGDRDLTDGEVNAVEEAESERDAINSTMALRAYSAAEKARSGCELSIDRNGRLVIRAGVLKPEQERKAKVQQANKARSKAAAAAGHKDEGALSNAIMQRLSEQLTFAAAEAIAKEPDLALAAIVAGLTSKGDYMGNGEVVCIDEKGLATKTSRHPNYKGQKVAPRSGAFAANLADNIKAGPKVTLSILAQIAGRSLDFQTRTATRPPLKSAGVEGLCNAINPKALNEALRQKFDAKDYFDSVNKALCLRAITEAVNADEARKVSGKPKNEVVAFALANIPKTGWLPPELRTAHYDGPGAKAKPAKKAKAKEGGRAK